MIQLVQRIPGRGSFMGSQSVFSGSYPSARLGQFDWLPGLITGALQATPAAIQAYQAKRVADRAKQDKENAQQAADAAKAQAEAAAKTAADAKAKADALLQAQGISPGGAGTKILGVDPTVAIVGGLGIIGFAAALWFWLGKKNDTVKPGKQGKQGK